MAPLSNQTSIRSASRYMGCPVADTNTMRSTYGLWRSISSNPLTSFRSLSVFNPASFALLNSSVSCFTEPIQISSVPSAVRQMGRVFPSSGSGSDSSQPDSQPLCKTSFTGASGLPVDGAVQLEQPVFDRSGSDEPESSG